MSDNLYCLLEAGIHRDQEAPCLHLSDGRILTYRDLEHGAARIAAYLVQQHVEPGDRVLVNAPKTPAFLMLYLAVLKIGAVFTPVNPHYTGAEIDQLVVDCKPRLIIEDCDAILTKSPTALREIVTPRTARDLAALIYTSGTTGAVIVGTSSPVDLIAETRKVLAPYKVPRQIEFIGKLPRNAMGKVQKDMLRRTYSAPAK